MWSEAIYAATYLLNNNNISALLKTNNVNSPVKKFSSEKRKKEIEFDSGLRFYMWGLYQNTKSNKKIKWKKQKNLSTIYLSTIYAPTEVTDYGKKKTEKKKNSGKRC